MYIFDHDKAAISEGEGAEDTEREQEKLGSNRVRVTISLEKP